MRFLILEFLEAALNSLVACLLETDWPASYGQEKNSHSSTVIDTQM